jgi:primosomal protein N' (replication factor Y)
MYFSPPYFRKIFWKRQSTIFFPFVFKAFGHNRLFYSFSCFFYFCNTSFVKKFVDIAFRQRIPSNNNGLFTFSVPEYLEKDIAQGAIVIAPVKEEYKRAVIVRIHEKKPLFDTKDIFEVCTPSLMQSWQFVLAQEVAQKNFVPLAKVLPLFLPQGVFEGSGNIPCKTLVCLKKYPENQLRPLGKVMSFIVCTLEEKKEMELSEILKMSGGTRKTVDRLMERGLVEYRYVPLFSSLPLPNICFPELSQQQIKVYQKMKEYSQCLLFAPSGSGKSHLLRMLVNDIIQGGKTVLILIPEIGITEDAVRKYRDIFGDVVAMYHSQLSKSEKAAIFWKVKQGVVKIIVGSRISLFLPFFRLGLVALEEEHEWTFKSEKSPRYHARDVAKDLAKIHGAKYILSSATPSLESLHSFGAKILSFTKEKKDNSTSILRLPSRTLSPSVFFVDIKEEMLSKNILLLSRLLQKKMWETFERKQQVLLFLNRRGFHRALICENCSEVVRCSCCHTSLVPHVKEGKEFLLCHHCGKVFSTPKKCSSCHGTHFCSVGSGTAKIEHIVQRMFPGKKVLRIDRDTTARKSDFSKMYADISDGVADVFVGTQMIVKNIDGNNIGLVGILDADSELYIPDFRSAEKTIQLLMRIIGRSGRCGKMAEIVLQTRMPENPLFSFLKDGNIDAFYKQEFEVRKKFFLPPFRRIIKLIFSGKRKDSVFAQARETQRLLLAVAKRVFPNERVEVSVSPPFGGRQGGKIFANVLITASNPEKILMATPVKKCQIDSDPLRSV